MIGGMFYVRIMSRSSEKAARPVSEVRGIESGEKLGEELARPALDVRGVN